jgi:threonine dehydrogenase-like Zn-dependent dehydrogenase
MTVKKAWILHGPRDLRLEDVELDTDNLKPDEVYVETDASALSTGTDRGNYEGAEQVPGAPGYPRWVGYSQAGTVMKVGSGVTRYAPGDRVFSLQSHRAAYIARETDTMVHIPDGVSSEHAAMAYLYHLGFHSLRAGQFTPGENVAVVGTGILGLTTTALARAFGARVVALSNSEYRMEMARKVGAHRAWPSNDPDLQEKLLDFTDGIGIDLVVLAANPWPAYRTAVESVRAGGRLAILSLPGRGEDDLDFNPLSLKWSYGKNLLIKMVGGPTPYMFPLQGGVDRWVKDNGLRYLLHLMDSGTIDPEPLISHRLPYNRAVEAYEMAYNRDKSMVGVIFHWK